MARLATRFGRIRDTVQSTSTEALTDAQIRAVVPSIYADAPHASRSERYTYIPTGEVLAALRKEGFAPFMATQTRVRDASRREHTKHMVRVRHASQIQGEAVNEVILVNSHDGSSCYQMLGGVFRGACANGLVWGDATCDVRVPHKGDVAGQVVAGAYEVLDGFTRIVEEREGMQALALNEGERNAFARSALALRFDAEAAPVTEEQVLTPRRFGDHRQDLWTTFNRVQENLVRGGLPGRSGQGHRTSTRAVRGIDQGLALNRALWVLANEMRLLKQ